VHGASSCFVQGKRPDCAHPDSDELQVGLFVCSSFCRFVCSFVRLFGYSVARVFVCSFACLFVCSSVRLYVCVWFRVCVRVRALGLSSRGHGLNCFLVAQHVVCSQAPRAFIEAQSHIKDPFRRTFAGMLGALDEAIFNVSNALEARGMLDNTVRCHVLKLDRLQWRS
jgi:hypothetical protein